MACWTCTSNCLILSMNVSLLGHCTAHPRSSRSNSCMFSTPALLSGSLPSFTQSGTTRRTWHNSSCVDLFCSVKCPLEILWQNLKSPYLAIRLTDNPSIDTLLHTTALVGHYKITVLLNMHVMHSFQQGLRLLCQKKLQRCLS